MVAQLGQPGNYSGSSEMHEVGALKIIGVAKPMPGVVNCALREY